MVKAKVKQLQRKGHSVLQEVWFPALLGVLTVLHRKVPELRRESLKGFFNIGGFELQAFLEDDGWHWELSHQKKVLLASGVAPDKEQLFSDVFAAAARKHKEIVARAKAEAKAQHVIAQAFINMGYDPQAFGF